MAKKTHELALCGVLCALAVAFLWLSGVIPLSTYAWPILASATLLPAREECRKGVWYEEAGQICFLYEHDPAPQCWTYFRDAGGLKAHFSGDPPGAEAAAVSEMPDALVCPGPQVGV